IARFPARPDGLSELREHLAERATCTKRSEVLVSDEVAAKVTSDDACFGEMALQCLSARFHLGDASLLRCSSDAIPEGDDISLALCEGRVDRRVGLGELAHPRQHAPQAGQDQRAELWVLKSAQRIVKKLHGLFIVTEMERCHAGHLQQPLLRDSGARRLHNGLSKDMYVLPLLLPEQAVDGEHRLWRVLGHDEVLEPVHVAGFAL